MSQFFFFFLRKKCRASNYDDQNGFGWTEEYDGPTVLTDFKEEGPNPGTWIGGKKHHTIVLNLSRLPFPGSPVKNFFEQSTRGERQREWGSDRWMEKASPS
jgi:hypothetical protein